VVIYIYSELRVSRAKQHSLEKKADGQMRPATRGNNWERGVSPCR
jgi:hypothetical protein